MINHAQNIKLLNEAADHYEDELLYRIAQEYRDLLGALRTARRDMEEMKKGKRPDRPTGKLKITELKEKSSELFGIIDTSEDESEIYGALEAYKDVVIQMEIDLPDWYNGPYDDPERGLKARTERAFRRVRKFKNAR